MRSAPAAVLLALVVTACGSGGGVGTPITAHSADPELVAVLPTASEVAALAGAPQSGVAEQAVDQSQLSVDPDPRAPCGATMHIPSLQRGALRVLGSRAGFTVVEWTDHLAAGEAAAFVASARADMHPGCPAFRSETPSGRQENQFDGAIPVVTPDSDGLAFAERVRPVGASAWAYGYFVVVRHSNTLALFQTFSEHPLRDGFFRAAARLMAGKLAHLPAPN
jgi:hypothetical protein